MKQKPLHIIFTIRSYRHLPGFRKMIRTFAERGHSLSVLLYKSLTDESLEEIRALEQFPKNVTCDWMLPSTRGGTFIFHSRELLTYRKHLCMGAYSEFYPERWRKYLHPVLFRLFQWNAARTVLKTGFAGMVLRCIEWLTPPQKDVTEHIKKLQPDVLLASPMNLRFSSMELEYVKAAKALGVPTALPIASWDNITTKGVYHSKPDIFLVWNDVQIGEAMEHHGISRSQLHAVGAITFDHWFPPPTPSSRKEFCARYGLRAEDPILAYLGSSVVTAKDESWLVYKVRELLDQSADPRLRNVQILLRPHPKHYKIYDGVHVRDTTIVPLGGPLHDPTDEKQLLYDTIYHAAAVTGVNSSSMLDAIVIDKQVLALYTGRYDNMQVETYHFPQLVKARAIELVDILTTPDEFSKHISDILDGNDIHKQDRKLFFERYIRPLGSSVSAGEAIVNEVERLAREKKNSII